MLIPVLDAQAQSHLIAVQGQDQINDYSGNLGAPAVNPNPIFQQVMPANPNRAGWLFQNTSPHAMLLNELNTTVASSWVINSGEAFPPPGFPIPTGIISVTGSADSVAGDTFTARDWQTAIGE